VPEKPVPVLTEAQCRALLRTCDGKGFVNRRETAILRLFVDTGMRLAELAGLTLTDLDLELRPAVAFVVRRGRRQRACAMGAKTELALDRYLRQRPRHRRARSAGVVVRCKRPHSDDRQRHRTDGEEAGRDRHARPAPARRTALVGVRRTDLRAR
jgi:site-specific recombinase XerD